MREQSYHTAGFQMSLPRIVEGRGADSIEWSMFAGNVCTGREDWLFLLSLLHGPFLRHSSVPCGPHLAGQMPAVGACPAMWLILAHHFIFVALSTRFYG